MREYIFSISRKDLRLADKKLRLRLRRITPRKYSVGNFLLGVVLWIPVGFGWAYTKQHYGMKASLVLLGVVACVLLSWKASSYLSAKNIAGLQDKERKDIIHASIGLSKSMLKLTMDSSSVEMERDEISEIEEDSETCFIYIGPLFCYVIPKSGFDMENEYEELMQQLQTST